MCDEDQPQIYTILFALNCGPSISFDLGSSVGDLVWSHLGAASFVAVTADGKVSEDLNSCAKLINTQLVRRATASFAYKYVCHEH